MINEGAGTSASATTAAPPQAETTSPPPPRSPSPASLRERAKERIVEQLQGLSRFVVLQNSSNPSHVVLFDTQHGRTPPAGSQTYAVSDIRDMVFGVLPTTDNEATKLHLLPGPQCPSLVVLSKLFACKPGGGSGDKTPDHTPRTLHQAPPAINLRPIGTTPFSAQSPASSPSPSPAPAPSTTSMTSIASLSSSQTQMRATRRVTMALVMMMQSAGESRLSQRMRMFVAAHFLIVDLRMCKAVRRIKEHVTALLSAQASVVPISPSAAASAVAPDASPSTSSGRSFTAIANPFSGAYAPRGSNASLRGLSLQEDDIVAREVDTLLESVACLLRGPRIERPLWPGIVHRASVAASQPTGQSPGRRLLALKTPEAMRLLEKLVLLKDFDTTKSNNFVSASITAVLCTHRAWVATVGAEFAPAQPAGSHVFRNYLGKHLSELQGSSLGGNLARAVIVGDDEGPVNALLEVLSYFIRAPSVLMNSLLPYPEPPQRSSIPQITSQPPPSDFYGAPPAPPSLQETGPAQTPQRQAGPRPWTTVEPIPSASYANGAALSVVQLPSESDFALLPAPVHSSQGPGLSLFGAYQARFQPDFVLMGIGAQTYSSLLDSLAEELRYQTDLHEQYLAEDDTPVAVIGDLGSRIVETVVLTPVDKTVTPRAAGRMLLPLSPSGFNSFANPFTGRADGITRKPVYPSAHVMTTIATATSLFELGVPADMCLAYIEDRLRELISTTRIVLEYLRITAAAPSREQLEADLQLGPGDLHLIGSILQGSRRWPLT